MCGIAGYFDPEKLSVSRETLEKMANAIRHRGPDSSGFSISTTQHLGLAHRRLSILDLSSAGNQPMPSASNRYVMVFNGEIYNHHKLRAELEACGKAPAWQGHSDTETVLAAIEAWGLNDTIQKTTGMFALALWDQETGSLTLARDRFGEKPLYYGWQGQGNRSAFLFGSELKALKAHPYFQGELDRSAISLLLRHNCIPAPYSVYKGIAKLIPGHLLTFTEQDFAAQRIPASTPYWSFVDVALQGARHPWQGSDEEAIDRLDHVLREAIGQQMIADVPLGAFLSGGIDSSTIVALMQAQSSRPVRTFSIGFHEEGYNEAVYAKAVAKHLGTDHTELYIKPEEAMAVIPMLPDMYDEPFADSSQIPTYLVSRLARQSVSVSLSGDAGDELFCGYNRYQMTSQMWHKLHAVPGLLRKVSAGMLSSLSPSQWNQLARILPGASHYARLGEKVHKGATVLGASSLHELYLGFVSHWPDPASIVIGGKEPPTLVTGNRPDLDALNGVQQMMVLDTITYLPDDILVKVDRASMAVSLECRAPYLDHHVAELAWQFPQSLKLRDGKSKWVLRQVLNRPPCQTSCRPDRIHNQGV
ncbi:MAG: asparagine synthase (glutamine-hydrolyzing), partial [Lautropia sp.]|nr:asparagine synthase (glutamine-hydrolyzing) [Lautropia sp.]